VPPRSPKKPEPPFATTEEMVAITNVERQTLRQWVRRGLLPPAKIVSDGNGVKSRWPRVALEQARFIKEMRAQLYSLDEILRWCSSAGRPVLPRHVAPPQEHRRAGQAARTIRSAGVAVDCSSGSDEEPRYRATIPRP
jgi:DNA-binding transcriptional MerR regulator